MTIIEITQKSQLHSPSFQDTELRTRYSAFNALFVYVVFFACFVPQVLSEVDDYKKLSLTTSVSVVEQVKPFLFYFP